MNNIKCLFGYHEFVIPNKDDKYILMCKHCMRKGYYRDVDGYEVWLDYDEKGKVIHYKTSDGFEEWKHYEKRRILNIQRRKNDKKTNACRKS